MPRAAHQFRFLSCCAILLGMDHKDRRIQELQGQLAEKDQVITELRGIVAELRALVAEQQVVIIKLQTQVADLETRLNRNSGNSSQPPSSDLPWQKRKSRRKPTGRKPGGQKGHPGRTLNQVATPDHVVEHNLNCCADCGADLRGIEPDRYETRQVFDIPEPKVEVTEHRISTRVCPKCVSRNKADSPAGVNSPVQYGTHIRAVAAYLWGQHFIPYERLSEALSALFKAKISPGTLFSHFPQIHAHLLPFIEGVRKGLIAASCVHFDETGFRIGKRLCWLHSASSDQLVLFYPHAKRGRDAMDDMNILPRYTGTAVHDGWGPYAKYKDCSHSLCNAHHLRELECLAEDHSESWANRMREYLLSARKEIESCDAEAGLPSKRLGELVAEYQSIVASGKEYHATLPPLPRGKRGRQKQRPGKNLLDRLEKKEDNVLRFLHDPGIPFTNNEAERDIRMMKLKQKISGCFRTSPGAEVFCRIRSYLGTARKQKWNIFEALTLATQGRPKLVPT